MENYILILDNLSIKQKCDIWYDLNYWNWNTLLGEKPKEWDSLPNHSGTKNKYQIIEPIMSQIVKTVPDRKLTYAWNKRYYNENKRGNKSSFLIWHFKHVFFDYFHNFINFFGIYTKKQRKMFEVLNSIKEQEHQNELRKLYGGGK